MERKVYVSTSEVIEELQRLPECQIDYITFSGRGESTLAKNLGDTIKSIKTLRKEKVAVLTNSSLMNMVDVRENLLLADFVIAKLDASSQKILESINKPASGIKFNEIYQGIKLFRKEYAGKLALQIMFIDENKEFADRLAELSLELKPDEVQINTPLRLCEIKPLSPNEIFEIKGHFIGLNVITVYDKKLQDVKPISPEDTLKRRGRE